MGSKTDVLKNTFASAAMITALYGALSAMTTLVCYSASQTNTQPMSARSLALLKAHYQSLADQSNNDVVALHAEQQALTEHMIAVNHEIHNGPSDWLWCIAPIDGNSHFFDEDSIVEEFKVATFFVDDVEMATLDLKLGGPSVITLNKDLSIDEAATQAIALLDYACRNIESAMAYSGVSPFGLYSLASENVVTFSSPQTDIAGNDAEVSAPEPSPHS